MENEWLIEDRLLPQELYANLASYNEQYAGKVYHHKNGGTYVIHGFSVLSHKNIAEYAVNYHVVDVYDNRTDFSMTHTRPAREFFDGTRFKCISK